MNPNGKPKALTSEFALLPVSYRPGVASAYPVMRLQVKPGKLAPRAMLRMNRSCLNLLGIKDRKSGAYVQIYLSNLGIKIVRCRADSDQARKINADGAIVVNETVEILGLVQGDIWDCEAYGVDSTSDRFGAAIGSFPAALRDRLTGASR